MKFVILALLLFTVACEDEPTYQELPPTVTKAVERETTKLDKKTAGTATVKEALTSDTSDSEESDVTKEEVVKEGKRAQGIE